MASAFALHVVREGCDSFIHSTFTSAIEHSTDQFRVPRQFGAPHAHGTLLSVSSSLNLQTFVQAVSEAFAALEARY